MKRLIRLVAGLSPFVFTSPAAADQPVGLAWWFSAKRNDDTHNIIRGG